MSGPNAPPINRLPPGQTNKPMGADRVPMSSEVPRPNPMAVAIKNSIAARARPSDADVNTVIQAPTDTNVEMFEQKYGPGSTAKILGPQVGIPIPRPRIDMLDADLIRKMPTDMNLEMFDQKYGDGAAASIIGPPVEPGERSNPQYAPSQQQGPARYEKAPKGKGKFTATNQSVNRSGKGDPAVAMATKTIDEAGTKPPSKAPAPAPEPEQPEEEE